MRERDALLAVVLLAVGAIHHYGWALYPADVAPQIWNVTGAAVRLGLLAALLWRARGVALAVGAWWAAEELLVIGCSVAYIVKPWEVPDGSAQCSSLLGYDLGKIGALVLAVLVVALLRHPSKVDR